MRYNSKVHASGIAQVESWITQCFRKATICVIETPWGLEWHLRVADRRPSQSLCDFTRMCFPIRQDSFARSLS
jgi:hypothetical protein